MYMTVVPLSASHITHIAALEALCFEDPWSESALAEELDNPCAHFWVAIQKDLVIGYAGCHHIAGEGFIANVAVHPDHRRCGVARRLLSAVIAEGHDLSRITLEVRESNAAAIALYRSLGFVKEGVRPHFYTHPTEDAGIYSYFPSQG